MFFKAYIPLSKITKIYLQFIDTPWSEKNDSTFYYRNNFFYKLTANELS